jgi:heptosyltransferase III
MKILLIKTRHIGDTLLLTPSAKAIRRAYPEATLWVLVRKSCEGILEGCPEIDRVLTTANPEADNRHWYSVFGDIFTIRAIRDEKFDYAFDLSEGARGRWMTLFSGAKTRIGMSVRPPKRTIFRDLCLTRICHLHPFTGHAVEKDIQTISSVLDLGETIPPLAFERRCCKESALIPPDANFAFIHPGTRWERKKWFVEKWIAFCNRIKANHDWILVSTGSDESELSLAREIRAACGDKIVLTEGRLTWAESAGLLYRAQIFIGVDTAMCHLAAACQCPIVGLFGPSDERVWRPWKARHQLVFPPDKALQGNLPPQEKKLRRNALRTTDIELVEVLAAYENLRVRDGSLREARGVCPGHRYLQPNGGSQ